MTKTPLCVEAGDPVTKAQSLMRDTGYRALPVCVGNRIIGVLSRGDALTVTSRKTNVEVRGVMSHNVVVVSEEEDIFSAAKKLTGAGVKQMPVVDDGGGIIGIISSMDILKVFVGKGYKNVKKGVGEVMSTDPVHCSEDEEVSRIWNLMEKSGFGAFPVIDGKFRVIGVVTRMDIMRKRSLHIGKESGKSKRVAIKKAMVSKPYTVKADTGTREAAGIMVEKKIIRLPVVDADNKLIGIVDSEDILRSYLS